MGKYKQTIEMAFRGEGPQIMCSEWRLWLAERHPELFDIKFTIGDWVFSEKDGETIGPYRITRICDGLCYGYGFGVSGSWVIRNNVPWARPTRKATFEEVEESLIKEATLRGFVRGANVIGLGSHHGFISGKCPLDAGKPLLYTDEMLWANRDNGSNIVIYENGKWATIVEQIPEDIKNLEAKYGKEEIIEYLNRI